MTAARLALSPVSFIFIQNRPAIGNGSALRSLTADQCLKDRCRSLRRQEFPADGLSDRLILFRCGHMPFLANRHNLRMAAATAIVAVC
jgi:hypothetical protein